MAVVWQSFAARCFSLPLRPVAQVILFLTVWVIYLGDRLLDVRHPPTASESPRHRFYRRHRRLAFILLTLAIAAASALCLLELRPAVLRTGCLALTGVLAYLALVHLYDVHVFFPKQLAAALLFAGGTFAAPWALCPDPVRILLIPWGFFAVLCLGNLVAIEGWESEVPPQLLTRTLEEYLRLWMPAVAVAALAFVGKPYYQAVAASAAAITAISIWEEQLSLDLRRVLVDAALLTPLLFYWL
ncbi:hypothetical protein [uncultured Paludibaculum sp.]|uniref:hypothetical protein n=1 Tax=uncultured Paludibaculum sp. TaxID=1765020 RepID=UPI002AABDC16|nr:hypothetical protein [uncultured Paludibaculum sp.]